MRDFNIRDGGIAQVARYFSVCVGFAVVGAAVPLMLNPRTPTVEGGRASGTSSAQVAVNIASPTAAIIPHTVTALFSATEQTPAAATASPVASEPAVTIEVAGASAQLQVLARVPLPATTAVQTTPLIVPDTPVAAVRMFYELVEQKQFQAAEQLWSQHMRQAFPPSQNISQRFAQTQQLTVQRAELIELHDAGQATVNVVVLEQQLERARPRRYTGTWNLLRTGGAWLLDEPDLHLE